jgi:uncharacterized membrane protein YraQ (UPF0718 family)
MDEDPGTPETCETPEPDATLESRPLDPSNSQITVVSKKEKKDFWTGLLGSVYGNLLLAVIITIAGGMLTYQPPPALKDSPNGNELITALSIAIYAFPFVVNIGVLIFFVVKHRPGIVKGMLTSYGLALLLALVGPVFIDVLCYATGYS